MNFEKTFRSNLRLYAVIVLSSSVLHGAWNWFFPTYVEMQGLTDLQWSTFILFNWAIAFLLLFLGVLSLTVSIAGSVTLPQLRVFSAFSAGFWFCRLLLEFLFPVQIPVIVIPDASTALKGLLIVVVVILVFPELRLRLAKGSEIETTRAS